MKQMVLALFALLLFGRAQAQYEPGKLAIGLTENALEGITIEVDGSATLDSKIESLNELNSKNDLVAMYPMTYKEGSPFRTFFTFTFDESADLDGLITSYSANEYVQWVSKIPNGTPEVLGPYYPPDPRFPYLWWLNQGTDKADINAPEAWEWTQGDTNVVIAICGGGINWRTPSQYFCADLATNLWNGPNGIHGWSFFCNSPDIEDTCIQGDRLWWHGTPMASFAGSAIDSCTSDNCGVGVAPHCRIMGVTAPIYYGTSNSNSLIFASDNGAKVFAYAFGFDTNSTYMRQLVRTAFDAGMLFVNAGGNPGTPIFDIQYGVSVCNVDSNNIPVSNTGTPIKICAPSRYSGSSYAAPVAAGVAALMRAFNPYIPLPALRVIFMNPASCDTVPYSGTGAGRIDAYKAIKNVAATPTFVSIENDGNMHPLLRWSRNIFTRTSIMPFEIFSASSISYIIQKAHFGDTVFTSIDTVSSTDTTYVDPTEVITLGALPTRYRIRTLVAYDQNYVLSVPSNIINVISDPAKLAIREVLVPVQTRLFDNYPNPFNPSTQIRFDLANDGIVSLKVYDVLGREVNPVVNEFLNAGRYTRTFDATNLASGVYYYSLRTAGFAQTRKLLVVK